MQHIQVTEKPVLNDVTTRKGGEFCQKGTVSTATESTQKSSKEEDKEEESSQELPRWDFLNH